MEIAYRHFSRVDLLAISGRVDAASAPDLWRAIEQLFQEGRYRIVLDLAHLNHISSAGLRVLIDGRKRARDWKLTDLEGGDIRIANMPPRIREVFNLTGLTDLFEIYPDVTEAVGSF
ncbi:MAG: STAS domain-containing protein [Chloroflexaceae bacterium]|nr:STAS domain-containing protein [Chloroflexaceae bacterium]